MADHNDLGRAGEQLARKYLENKDYNILDCNWRFDHKEIDIIAVKNNHLVFVEVKTRSNDYFGKPFEAITEDKQALLTEAAEAYIETHDADYEARFDVISIILKEGKEPEIEHFEGAFIA